MCQNLAEKAEKHAKPPTGQRSGLYSKKINRKNTQFLRFKQAFKLFLSNKSFLLQFFGFTAKSVLGAKL